MKDEFRDQDTIDSLMAEINSMPSTETDIIESPKVELNKEDLEQFILNSSANTVESIRKRIEFLFNNMECSPDPEMISSISNLINSQTSAIETLTKLHLNKEKLKQAMELEQFKQATKLQIVDKHLENRPVMTREDLMKQLFPQANSNVIIDVTPIKEDPAPTS